MKINEIFEEIDYRIDETMSIADDVIAVANDVAKKIVEQIKVSGKSERYGRGKIKKGEFLYNGFGFSFTVAWERINYATKALNLTKIQTKGSTKMANNLLSFTFVTYSGKINEKEFYNTIQHEVSHYYELMLRGKPYPSKENYNKAVGILNAYDNIIDWAIASIIYMGVEYEHRAYGNGAYQYMMRSNDYGHNFRNVIKDTPLYQNLVQVRNAKDVLLSCQAKNGTDFVNQYLEQYRGLNFEKIISMAAKTEKALLYSLGRAKTKALLDYKIQHKILENRIGMLEYKEKNIEEDLKNFLEYD